MEPYPRPATGPAPQRPRSLGCFSWVLASVLIIITGFSGMVAYRLKDDAATVASVRTSFCIFLVLLLFCLWLKERAAAGSAWRDVLVAFFWALFTLLVFHVIYMAMGAAALTLRFALLMWFIPAACWAVFFVFFSCRGRVYQAPDENELLPPV